MIWLSYAYNLILLGRLLRVLFSQVELSSCKEIYKNCENVLIDLNTGEKSPRRIDQMIIDLGKIFLFEKKKNLILALVSA